MATDHSAQLTDVELLHDFIGARLSSGGRNDSIAQVMTDFAEYCRQLDQLRASLREAEAQIARGESKPLDLEALFARVDERLEREGVPE